MTFSKRMDSRSRTRRWAAVAALLVPAVAALTGGAVALSAAPASATTPPPYQSSQTFTYSNVHRSDTFTVPPAVTHISFDVRGASGARGGYPVTNIGGSGGAGAEITGELDVQPGWGFDLLLGGSGVGGTSGLYSGTGGTGGPGGGYGFSATGGSGGDANGSVSGGGGGGGGATVLERGGTVLAVAGGGGGGGGGGGIAGYDGGRGGDGAKTGGTGGTGGTGVGAGSGGGISACPNQDGGRGDDASYLAGGGGGGGGGYGTSWCSGAGGKAGTLGEGGGGGGGAGNSFILIPDVTNGTRGPSPLGGDGQVTFTWTQPETTLHVTAAKFGNTVQATAAVSPPAGISYPDPTGTVDFYESSSGTLVGSAEASGGSATVTATLSSGQHAIQAYYRGDTVYGGSTSFTYVALAKVAPVISVSTDSNPLRWGATGRVIGTVRPAAGAPSWAPMTGTVTLTDTTGPTPYVIVTEPVDQLVNGQVTSGQTWSTHAAAYSFTVDYSGDANYLPASSTVTVPVTPSAQSTTAVSSSQNPTPSGKTVTLTATVAATAGSAVPTGSVGFTYYASVLGSPYLVDLGTASVGAGGKAKLTATIVGEGTYHVLATYSGDANLQGSSTELDQTITAAAPPVAKAGSNQSLSSGATTTVDGSGSTDPQGEPLMYAWAQLDGPAVTFEDQHAARTRVTTPKGPATIHLRLTVTNGAGLSSTSDLALAVRPK